jgi:methylmalonyl-CoA mutase N-terminal domain/subunit
LEENQKQRVARIRAQRDSAAAAQAVAQVARAASDGSNLMPPIIEAVRRHATLGEIADAMRGVFGQHQPSHEF